LTLGLPLRVLEGDEGAKQCGDEAQLVEEEPGAVDGSRSAGGASRGGAYGGWRLGHMDKVQKAGAGRGRTHVKRRRDPALVHKKPTFDLAGACRGREEDGSMRGARRRWGAR
jgi:hypothetical protein